MYSYLSSKFLFRRKNILRNKIQAEIAEDMNIVEHYCVKVVQMSYNDPHWGFR